ncbi:hypothetical protein NY08_2820 [Rhodococcus sp. B7740]|nr:hypothetical protein NY08_2820 [Rhodococcus sp. B7740]
MRRGSLDVVSNIAPYPSSDAAAGFLDALRALRRDSGPLPGLAPDSYARDHAAFERLSDQRGLIA